jgi:hypothetical protein
VKLSRAIKGIRRMVQVNDLINPGAEQRATASNRPTLVDVAPFGDPSIAFL